MFCNKCGTKLEKDTVFCPECGSQVIEEVAETEIEGTVQDAEKTIISDKREEDKESVTENVDVEEVEAEQVEETNSHVVSALGEIEKIKYCPNCGIANAETDGFCHSCGTAFDGNDVKGSQRDEGFKCNGGKVIKVILGIAAIVAVVLLITFIGGLGKKENLIYLKDNEILKYAKKDTNEIGDSAYKYKDDAAGGGLDYIIQTSKDEKMLFYPQDYDGYKYDLYYKELADTKSDGEKIDSDVIQYTVLENNKLVYLKDDGEYKLYISDLKDKKKISNDVNWFRISENEKEIFWFSTEDGKMYICDLALKEEKIKLDSDVIQVVYLSDDLKDIVYRNEKGLYCISDLEEQKIDSDVTASYVVKNGDNVEIYYTVSDEEAFTYEDVVNDDYAEQDAAMTEPRIEDYQTTEIQPSFWGEREVTVTDDSYYTDYEEYTQKIYRDEYREYLAGTELYQKESIYRYTPGMAESEKLTSGIITNRMGYSNPVFIYGKINEENMDKVKLSDLMEEDYYNIDTALTEKINEAQEMYMVKDGKEVLLDIDTNAYLCNLYIAATDEDEKVVYLAIYEDSDDYTLDLFKVNYGKMSGELELLAEDFVNVELMAEEGIYYTVEAGSGCGELYLNDEKIDSDVLIASVEQLGDEKGILYLTDMSDNLEEGTLKMYSGSESERIADEVVDYDSNSKGDIVYITDYNFDKYRGDLKKYEKKGSVSIDDDVTAILYY